MIMKLVLEANNMVLDSIDNFEHFQPKIVSDSELFEVMNYKPSTTIECYALHNRY